MGALAMLIQRRGNRDVHTGIPVALVTGTGTDPRPRLRVDASQTSFWEGREFRTYHEFTLAAGASVWLRFATPLDVVIHGRTLTVVQGNVRFALGTGGTPSGTWTNKAVFPVNAISGTPPYANQVLAATGGTVSGMTERDVMLSETGGTQASTVVQTIGEVGLGAETYYVEVRNTGGSQARGIYHVHWEERQPPATSVIY